MNTSVSPLNPRRRHAELVVKNTPRMAWREGDQSAWRAQWRAQLERTLGLDRLLAQERPPLAVRTLWRREHELGVIEKIIFTAEPGSDVPAYLCVPHGFEAPGPFFICVQGHSTGMHKSIAVDLHDNEKPIQTEGDRDYALGCMRRGVAALCIEQRAFGERADFPSDNKWVNRCHNPAMHALMLGRTLLAERIYDVDRGIDYLMTRDDVDPARLGLMGNSGGGTVSTFAGGLLDRVTHVMPSCSFSTFADSIMSIDHCCCNYVPGLLDWGEAAEVAGLIAPRPLVIVNGRDDPIFPIDASAREFARLQKIYAAAGAADLCHHVVCDGGHRFYADQAWAAMLPHLGLATAAGRTGSPSQFSLK
ncbi:MAG: alpha/beta hydrolase family protein [Verrucomicrobiota bacterium]